MSISVIVALYVASSAVRLCDAEILHQVRLRGGATASEGKVEVVRSNRWGAVCDDGWGMEEAHVVCRQLGFKGAYKSLTNSFYGNAPGPIWIKSVNCTGTELRIQHCRSTQISKHIKPWQYRKGNKKECTQDHLAGVVCEEFDDDKEAQDAIRDLVELGDPMPKANQSRLVKMHAGDMYQVCADTWGSKETIVVCRQRERMFGNLTLMVTPGEVDINGIPVTVPELSVRKINCNGDEESLQDCTFEVDSRECKKGYAAVTCSPVAPDISVMMNDLQTSIHVMTKPEKDLVCAKTENCMSKSGMEKSNRALRKSKFHRRFLVFTSNVQNLGNADFRPPQVKGGWFWHDCHNHFHSINNFATYELKSIADERVVESGHKVSFCLRDSYCFDYKPRKYNCTENIEDGDQGISVGCADFYKYDLDCQWIDITDVKDGRYYLDIKTNPNMLVPEQDYSNNYIRCEILINPTHSRGWGCRIPADFV